jgi:hypothetical protein
MSAYVSMRQCMSAYVSIRQHTMLRCTVSCEPVVSHVCIRQHASVYADIRQHTLRVECLLSLSQLASSKPLLRWRSIRWRMHLSIRWRMHLSIQLASSKPLLAWPGTSAYVSIRQHTSAYVSIRQHTSAFANVHTSRVSLCRNLQLVRL